MSFVAGTLVGVPFDAWMLGAQTVESASYKHSVLIGYLVGGPLFGLFAWWYLFQWSSSLTPTEAACKVAVIGLPVVWLVWGVLSSLFAPWAKEASTAYRVLNVPTSLALGIVAALATASSMGPLFQAIIRSE